MVGEEEVQEVLQDVMDPEIQIDIVNLGMIYGVEIKDDGKAVHIRMTLTTMGCPAWDGMKKDIEQKVTSLPGVEVCDIDLVFDPPWSKDKMSEDAKTVMKYLF